MISSKSLVSLSDNSLRQFLSQVYAAPILTQEQELYYTQQFTQNKDSEALKQLVLSHMRFVVHIAKRYQNFGVQLTDLIQEGTVGLIKAVHRFDASFNARLASFAVFWIKSSIHEYILKNWRLVKIATTKSQRKLFFNLHKFLKEVGSLSKDEVKFVADNLDVSEKEVVEMEKRLRADEASLDFEDSSFELATEESANPALQIEQLDERVQKQSMLQNALQSLDPRQKEVIMLRFLTDKKTKRADIAKKLNISAERVRQVENQALAFLKTKLGTQLLQIKK